MAEPPYDDAIAICRDAAALAQATNSDAACATSSRDAQKNLTLDFSRKPRGIPVWTAPRSLGRASVAKLVERYCTYAEQLADRLREADFEVLNRVVLNQVLVGCRRDAQTLAVRRTVLDSGEAWFGPTIWQRPPAFRISISSWRTTAGDMDRLAIALMGRSRRLLPAKGEEKRKMDIRDATAADILGITRIYNDAVLNTTAIWNTSVVDEANRAAWLEDRRKLRYPVLVASDADGDVAGYASFGDWRAWEGYRHTVEHSVYVRSDQRGKGLGEALTQALIGRARDCGKHVIVAGIEAENAASIRLHEKLGFEKTGHLKEVGTKFGRWLDLAFFQLRLDPEAPDAGFRADGTQTR